MTPEKSLGGPKGPTIQTPRTLGAKFFTDSALAKVLERYSLPVPNNADHERAERMKNTLKNFDALVTPREISNREWPDLFVFCVRPSVCNRHQITATAPATNRNSHSHINSSHSHCIIDTATARPPLLERDNHNFSTRPPQQPPLLLPPPVNILILFYHEDCIHRSFRIPHCNGRRHWIP